VLLGIQRQTAEAYVVESAGRITIGDDLKRGVLAVRDFQIAGHGHAAHTELAEPLFLEDGYQGDVEGTPDIVAQAEENFNGRRDVTHLQLDRATCDGP